MTVAFDAVGPSSAGATHAQSATSPMTLSWSHTCTGSNRLLIVSVAVGPAASDANVSALTVTYNGVSMTSVGRVHSNAATAGFVEMFRLIAPATGPNTVLVTCTFGGADSMSLSAGSVSFTGVDQTTPIAHTNTATGSSATPSVAVTSASGNMTIDAVANGSAITSATAPSTNRWLRNTDTFSAAGNGAASTQSGTASNTHAYTVTSDWWGIIAADIAAAAGAAAATLNWLLPEVATKARQVSTAALVTILAAETIVGVPQGEFLPTIVSQWGQPQEKAPVRPPIDKSMLLDPAWQIAPAPGEFAPTLLTQWQPDHAPGKRAATIVAAADPSFAPQPPTAAAPVPVVLNADDPIVLRRSARIVDREAVLAPRPAAVPVVAFSSDAIVVRQRPLTVDREESRPPAIAAGEFLVSYVTQWQPQTTDPQRPPISKIMLQETAWSIRPAQGEFLPFIVTQWLPDDKPGRRLATAYYAPEPGWSPQTIALPTLVLSDGDLPQWRKLPKLVDREESRPPAIAAGEFLQSYVTQWQPQDKDPQRPAIWSRSMVLDLAWPPAIAQGEFLPTLIAEWLPVDPPGKRLSTALLGADAFIAPQPPAPVIAQWLPGEPPGKRLATAFASPPEDRPPAIAFGQFLPSFVTQWAAQGDTAKPQRGWPVDNNEAHPAALTPAPVVIDAPGDIVGRRRARIVDAGEARPQGVIVSFTPTPSILLPGHEVSGLTANAKRQSLEEARPPAIAAGQFLPDFVQWLPVDPPVVARGQKRNVDPSELRAPTLLANYTPTPSILLPAHEVSERTRNPKLQSLEEARPVAIAAGEFLPNFVAQWLQTEQPNASRRIRVDRDEVRAPIVAQAATFVPAHDGDLTRAPIRKGMVFEPIFVSVAGQGSPVFVEQSQPIERLRARAKVDSAEIRAPYVAFTPTPTPTSWHPHPQDRDSVRSAISKGMLYAPTQWFPLPSPPVPPPAFVQNDEGATRTAYRRALLDSTAVGPILALQPAPGARPAKISIAILPRNRAPVRALLERDRVSAQAKLVRDRVIVTSLVPTRSS